MSTSPAILNTFPFSPRQILSTMADTAVAPVAPVEAAPAAEHPLHGSWTYCECPCQFHGALVRPQARPWRP